MKTHPALSRSIATLLALAPIGAYAAADTMTGAGAAVQPGVSWAPTTAAGGTIGVWSLGAIPGTGDNAIITATGLIDIRGSAAVFGATHSTEIQDINFNSTAALTLNNNSSSQDMLLILNGGRGAAFPLISAIGNFAYTIQGPGSNATVANQHPLLLQLKASGDIDVAANILTISSVIGESGGARSLNKTGAGRAILSGTNLYTGGTGVTGGVLEVGSNGGLGTGPAVVNGGTLEVNLANATLTAASITVNAGGRLAVRNLTMNNGVALAGGTLGTRTGDVGTFAGPVNVTANSSASLISYSTPANNQSITISGKLSGASALAITGNAGNAGGKALILTNTANDFSGAFNVAAGQRLSNIAAAGTGYTLGTGTVNLAGGFLRLNDNGAGNDGTIVYGTNINVGAGGGTIDVDRASGVNTGNTIALNTLTTGAVTTTINTGANGYKASFAGVTMTGDATIGVTGAASVTGAVTGGFGLTKAGAGTLTLAGANSYTGTTTVLGGTLSLTGSVAAGAAVGATATLGGTGTVTGNTAVQSTGILSPGVAGSGTLRTGGLAFGAAAADTATVNFTTNPTPGIINVGAAGGLVTNGAAGTVSLNLLSTLPSVGLHTIIGYSGGIGGTGFAAFTLGPLPNPRIVAALVNTGTAVALNVTAVDAPRWSGGLNGEWSTNILAAPKNWNLTVNVGTTDFITGDNVLFANTPGSRAVVLTAGDVTPASVVFDNDAANPYTLSGPGSILGTTGLVKTNGGTVIIGNTNSFTGPVSISTGTVSVNAVADGALPSPLGAGTAVTLASGGTLEFTGAAGSTNRPTTVGTGGGTVKVSAASTLTLAAAVSATGTFTLDNAGTATVSAAIAGGGGATLTGAGTTLVSGNITAGPLVKAGPGTATLTGAANAPTGTTITGGTLQIGDGTLVGSIGTAIIVNNATLAFNTPAANITIGNVITGTGAVTKTGAGNTTFNGANPNDYSGTTTVSSGSLILSKTTGVNAIGGNLIIGTAGTVAYGTTAGQLADHIPDTASITINGGTFGSGAGATAAAPTTGVTDTVGSVTVNSGSFLSGRGPTATPTPFTVTGAFSLLGGTGLVQRGGALTANTVQVASPATLDLDGGSTTPNQQSHLRVGAGGLNIANTTINFNAGPSVLNATSVGSIVTLNGNVTSVGTSTLARLNPTAAVAVAVVDLAAGVRTFDVTGTLSVAPDVGVAATDLATAGILKTGTGKLVLGGAQNYASLTSNAGRTDVLKAIGTGTSTVTANGGTINFTTDQTLTSLSIGNGAVVNVGSPLPPALAPTEAPGFEGGDVGAAAVPEPGSATLLLGGFVTLLGLRRRNG